MPYLCEIAISGPEVDFDEASQVTEAVTAAVEAGWHSPAIVSDQDVESGLEPGLEAGLELGDNSVLDYRVFGYPGGAIVLVVVDCDDLEQAALAAAALARHLITWSPDLLAYSVDKVSASRRDEPFEGDSWLRPEYADDEEEARWPQAELLGEELRSLGARYLLAGAVRSLWDPARTGGTVVDAQDVVAGSVEQPWGRELVSALGTLLIRAATSKRGVCGRLVVSGGGDPDLAEALLRRALLAGRDGATNGWADDETRGHLLLEGFMADHSLQWNRVPPDESPEETDRRAGRQLRDLMWAGLSALATLAAPHAAAVEGPWQLLVSLGDDEIVSILATREANRIEAATDRDVDELRGAAAAHAAIWLAIRRPELLDGEEGEWIVDLVAEDTSSFHQVVYQALMMAGTGPVRQAIMDQQVPPSVRSSMIDFVRAQAVTDSVGDGDEPGQGDDEADAYDDMHRALEAALGEGDDPDVLRGVLAIVGRSADLTETEINSHRDLAGYLTTRQELASALLTHAALFAAIMFSDEPDDDAIIGLNALSIVAKVAPAAAGEMAADLPDLVGEDPRLEPAARKRAQRWVEEALETAHATGAGAHISGGRDAGLLRKMIESGQGVPAEWEIHRLVAAAAEAAACVLHEAAAPDAAAAIFTRR